MISMLLALLMMSITTSAQLLWKVTGNQLQHPSYLFGTMHQADGSFIDSIAALTDVINSVDGVWVEIEKDKLLTPEALSYINSMMMAPPDSTLSQLLSAEGVKIVAGVVDKYFNGMVSMNAIEKLKPASGQEPEVGQSRQHARRRRADPRRCGRQGFAQPRDS